MDDSASTSSSPPPTSDPVAGSIPSLKQTTVSSGRSTPEAPRLSRSLEDVHNSVQVSYPGFAKRLFAFLGPAYLISVGYMDPGNWATDIQGGAGFRFELIWI